MPRQIVLVADGLTEGVHDLDKAIHPIESLPCRAETVHHICQIAVGIVPEGNVFRAGHAVGQLVQRVVGHEIGLAIGVDFLPQISGGIIHHPRHLPHGIGFGDKPVHLVEAKAHPLALGIDVGGAVPGRVVLETVFDSGPAFVSPAA